MAEQTSALRMSRGYATKEKSRWRLSCKSAAREASNPASISPENLYSECRLPSTKPPPQQRRHMAKA